MTTLWKWILGIVVVLAVIVAVPLGMHLLVNNGYIAAPAMYAFHHGSVDPAFDMPYRFDDGKGPGGFEPRGGWMHYGRGFGFFGPLMFFGGLILCVIGFIMARVDFGEFGRLESAAVLDTIGIDPDYRDRGVGRALVSQLLANLTSLRVDRILTEVDWADRDLIGFLGRCGFKPSTRLSFHYRLP